MNKMPSLFAWIVASLITVLLYPLLIVLWLSWREHERAALLSAAMPSPSVRCDGGMKAEAEQAFDYTEYLPEWWWN